jgi:hypothetical protein
MKKKTDIAVAPLGKTKRVKRTADTVVSSHSKKSPSRERVFVDSDGDSEKDGGSPRASTDLLDHLGALPRSYGEELIFLVAQDPHWLFTYWDIDISRHPGGPCFLRVEEASGVLEKEIEVSFEARNWYIPVAKAGGSYSVEIGFQRQGKWNALARSPIVTTPRDRFSESTVFDFATIPIHLSFQRLVESVSHSLASSEELLPALIKLQQGFPAGVSSGFSLEAREREILQALLGSEILAGISSAQWNSEELHSAISQRLRESLSSAEVAEFFSRLPEWNSESSLFSGFQKLSAELSGSSSLMGSAAFAGLLARLQELQTESSLFSGFQKLSAELAGSSMQLSSAAFTEILAVNLSSWLTGLISSWSGGGASETLARLSASSSWAGSELSSASEFAARAALSSWLLQAESSWKGAGVSVQALAAISSWSSEIMADQGFAGSSWSASQN